MAFTKAKIVMTGLAVTAVCIVAPQQLKAQVPEAQMDGVMGQSIEDETVYESKPDLDTLIEKNAPVFGNRTSLKKASSYSSAFLNASFTTAGDYTSATYYHKADYADDELVNGIDVSYWQADAALKKKYSKDKTKWTQTGLDWESIHGAGIDFAFVRVASRDTKDGSIYRDNCADSHIQGAVSNDINVGLYFFSQALNETEAREEAQYVLDMIDQYGWNVSMPIIMDREAGANKRLTAENFPKQKRQRYVRHLRIPLRQPDTGQAYMHLMRGSKTISIRMLCMTVPCGWHGTTIPRQAIQNQERHIRTWHTIMNSGSIHLLQK